MTDKVAYYEISSLVYREPKHELGVLAHYGVEIVLNVSELGGSLTREAGTVDDDYWR
jgi:hypothetical protein